jgi:hypothetical protein
VVTPAEQHYKDCKIHLAPSCTDSGSWTCGYSVFDTSGRVSFDGYMHGPFMTAERAKRAALREAKECIDHNDQAEELAKRSKSISHDPHAIPASSRRPST